MTLPVTKAGELALITRLVLALLAPLANLARGRIGDTLVRRGRSRRQRADDVADVIDLGPARSGIAEAVVQPLVRALTEGAAATASRLDIDFQLLPRDAIAWAEQRVGDLVVEIDDATKAAIRLTVVTALREGRSVPDTVEDIRTSVGLHSRWATAVSRYRARLVEEKRSTDQVERMVDRYHERLVRKRATVIARTELLRASNEGAMASYRRAEALGVFAGVPVKRWVVADDERLCPLCLPLNGVEVEGLAVPFPGTDVQHPPRHPNCRCRVVVRGGDARVAKHGKKGSPGYSLLHPGPQRPSAAEFVANFERVFRGDPFRAFVSHRTVEQIQSERMVPITINDGMTGVLVWDHQDGRVEATALYNRSTTRRDGDALLRHVINDHGVNYVECFGNVLRKQYQTAGFVVTEMYPFEEDLAPADWNYERFGRPRYHIMKLGGREMGSVRKAAEETSRQREVAQFRAQMLVEEGPGWVAENERYFEAWHEAADAIF